MSKQKEDVLLMVKHVRYKKVDGTLYVNSGRVAWRNQTSDSFRISAAFEDIRIQRISPDGKEKVQLQLLMHNGESFTFHFSDPAGRPKQLELRNSVKEMLQSLLPKFKDKAHSELKEKFRLLESNPDLLALYKELVVTGILSSDEFWARPEFTRTSSTVPAKRPRHTLDGNRSSSSTDPSSTTPVLSVNHAYPERSQLSADHSVPRSLHLDDRKQSVGVPSYLLSDIKPEADGANGIKYNLTHDTIDAIFRAYPAVRQRHRELVPDKLSEADFWIKFFQSHYFHRDRVNLPREDIFTECAAMDERHLLTEMRRSRRNRMAAHLDLACLTDHDLGAGYGVSAPLAVTNSSTNIQPTPTSDSQSQTASDEAQTQPTNLSSNQLLLRRFNNHSIMVLKSLGPGDIASGLTSSSTNSDHAGQSTSSDTVSQQAPLRQRIYGPELVQDPQLPRFSLDLTNVNDYLQGPMTRVQSETDRPVQNQTSASYRPSASSISYSVLEQAILKCKRAVEEFYGTERKLRLPLIAPLEAQLALADVSAGGCLVGGSKSTESLNSSRLPSESVGDDAAKCRTSIGVPDVCRLGSGSAAGSRTSQEATSGDVHRGPMLLSNDQSRELSLLYASASELLRHFWACFPVTTDQLAGKLDRIASSLNRFRLSKVYQFTASLDQSFNGKGDSAISVATSSGITESSKDHREVRTPPVKSSIHRSRTTAHLESMLDAAQLKYTEWKTRQRKSQD